ncbi:bifunctional pyr operon transcriptional regulator/uracil phosphoribosyltransferase PyrR [Corynebacterium mendelii]|uniref:Bifunctional protein PyrR n=1 Tax=Corynebacterium mendelii TaxID=2765362 RepID=A0A939IWH2_9CORY|nr:bifunctional pyr operon transcriptional regulator/uracil phosphoribosyltransferase PyrR [Corynebacterium mendelii]MBN9643415.1 bifunctional pyr operon transcriptional regulator/uracil phosphoribosyltransferase PyrR [Corynebacterium mendelii]
MSSPNQESGPAELFSPDDVSRTVARIAHQIIEKTQIGSGSCGEVVLLGIPSGGVPLAKRLAGKIGEFTSAEIPCGALDITLYRDDLGRGPHRALKKTTIPDCGVDNKIVVLVDDVLYSGRTIRAALDALRDIGRPAKTQLAVLVDRGHRELPIRADYVGKNIPTSIREDVTVYLTEIDGRDGVELTHKANPEGEK